MVGPGPRCGGPDWADIGLVVIRRLRAKCSRITTPRSCTLIQPTQSRRRSSQSQHRPQLPSGSPVQPWARCRPQPTSRWTRLPHQHCPAHLQRVRLSGLLPTHKTLWLAGAPSPPPRSAPPPQGIFAPVQPTQPPTRRYQSPARLRSFLTAPARALRAPPLPPSSPPPAPAAPPRPPRTSPHPSARRPGRTPIRRAGSGSSRARCQVSWPIGV